MSPTRLRELLKSPSTYAKELYESMSQLRYTDSGGKDVWDLWSELPIEEQDSFIDAMLMTVIEPVRQLIEEYDERIMLLKTQPAPTSGPVKCYYCGQKYAIVNNACGDCIDNG